MTEQRPLSRRAFFPVLTGAISFAFGAQAQGARPFPQWVESFRARALERGVSDATYTKVMGNLKPDTSVFAAIRNQPEFQEKIWQYLNRRVSDWRIQTGKEKLKEHGALLARIEKDTGVSRTVLLALWGIESAYGDPDVQKSAMRPVFPSLAALAWGEARRRKYWEQELINALRIVERGWSTPAEMRGSWAGAMGHTQWMPEVWLNVGMDYDGDGRVSPFGKPDDALASTAHYLVNRGKYRRGEHWGYVVKRRQAARRRCLQELRRLAEGRRHPRRRPSVPLARGDRQALGADAGRSGFLLGPNFYAVRSYNPSMNYTLSIVHLADVINGGELVAPKFPGGERPPTLAEIQEIQRRLTALGFDTKGADGRVGAGTMQAVSDYQRKVGLEPDGYAGVSLLARLRQGS